MRYFGDSFEIIEARKNKDRDSDLVLYVKGHLENFSYSDKDVHDIAWALVQFVSSGYDLSKNTINLSVDAMNASRIGNCDIVAKKIKLYVVEWDAWSFEGIFKNKIEAKANISHYLENIKEVLVDDEITNGEVFIPMDGKGDWVGVYITEQDAIEKLKLIPFEHDYVIQKIKIIDYGTQS